MELKDIFLIMGFVILIGFVGRLMREKTKTPEALFLIIFGLVLGPVTGIFSAQIIQDMVPLISTAAMVCILIESGIDFKITRIKGAIGTATAFTLLVAIITTLLITIFLVVFFNWPIAHAALLGLISSGTTTLTAMTLLNGIKVPDKIKNMIFLETILNDFTLITGTFIIIEFMRINKFGISEATNLFLSELLIGLLIGVFASIIWRHVLLKLNKKKELIYASTLGACFILYYIVSFFGGSAIISIFIFSLFLANYERVTSFLNLSNGKDEDGFHEYLSRIQAIQTDFGFFIASAFFVMLGMIFDPNVITLELFFIAIGILILIILSRALATKMISRKDKDVAKYSGLISIMVPRGYVAAVLIFVPLQQGIVIPGIANIMIFLIISTTVVAIIGTALYLRKNN